MKYKTIVNFVDEHNEGGIILAKDFEVSKVILVFKQNSEYNIEKLKEIYYKVINKVEIEEVKISNGNPNEIKALVEKYSSSDTIFNLTGGDRINSLLMFQYIKDKNQKCVYVDILNKNLYSFSGSVLIKKEDIVDLEIKDLAEASGANIVVDSTELLRKKDIIDITNKIQSNLDIWHKYKQRLYDSNTFFHDYKDNRLVIIHKDKLLPQELEMVNKCLRFLEQREGIRIVESKEEIRVLFLNNYLKGFIFKSGTWLEVFTNLIIAEIKEIDEAKSGVVFFWNDKAKVVRNELDVVAIKDSILICISCKDSEKYDENALNELNVYANRLGGKNAKKVLVATKEPFKVSVKERAKQMGISLIILGKDINKFRRELIQALK
ncbi:MAG: Card1-like endonuclease domain-containing protein [Clostridium sp.]